MLVPSTCGFQNSSRGLAFMDNSVSFCGQSAINPTNLVGLPIKMAC